MLPNDAEGEGEEEEEEEEVRAAHLSLSDLLVEAVVRCGAVT